MFNPLLITWFQLGCIVWTFFTLHSICCRFRLDSKCFVGNFCIGYMCCRPLFSYCAIISFIAGWWCQKPVQRYGHTFRSHVAALNHVQLDSWSECYFKTLEAHFVSFIKIISSSKHDQKHGQKYRPKMTIQSLRDQNVVYQNQQKRINYLSICAFKLLQRQLFFRSEGDESDETTCVFASVILYKIYGPL